MDGQVEVIIMLSQLSDVVLVEAGAELGNIPEICLIYVLYIHLRFTYYMPQII